MGYHGGLCNLDYIFNEDYEIQTENTKTLQNTYRVLMRNYEIPNLCCLTEIIEPSSIKIVSPDFYLLPMSP